jgi:nucleotide-binding universal stress UspA family protein
VVVERAADPKAAILAHAAEADLVVLGMHLERRRRALGGFALAFARETDRPLVIIGRRPGRALDRPLVRPPGL